MPRCIRFRHAATTDSDRALVRQRFRASVARGDCARSACDRGTWSLETTWVPRSVKSIPSTSGFKSVAVGAAGALLFWGQPVRCCLEIDRSYETVRRGSLKGKCGGLDSVSECHHVRYQRPANAEPGERDGFRSHRPRRRGHCIHSWSVPFDLVTTSRFVTASTTLAPGSYGHISIQSGTVTIQAGTYYVDSLTLEQNATTTAGAAGPVYVDIRTSFIQCDGCSSAATWVAAAAAAGYETTLEAPSLKEHAQSLAQSLLEAPGPEGSYSYPAPDGWVEESYAAPQPWASDFPWTGTETVHFPPGWPDPASSEWWSYNYVIGVDSGPTVTAKRLGNALTDYYKGLVSCGIQLPCDPDRFEGQMRSVVRVGSLEVFQGHVDSYDFSPSPLPITLDLLVTSVVCPKSKHRALLVSASPEPASDSTWTELLNAQLLFRCK